MRIALTHKNNPCSYGLGQDQWHSGKNLFPRGIHLWRLLEQAYRRYYHRSRCILLEKYARGRTNDQLRELQSFRGCSLWLSRPGRSCTGWNSRRTMGWLVLVLGRKRGAWRDGTDVEVIRASGNVVGKVTVLIQCQSSRAKDRVGEHTPKFPPMAYWK
jgi:hypothetical protein